ncbi:MAG: RNA pseudouridine synthase [Rhizobiales bacterium]|nr:RNA pseudouridine synthase [Hyphomicrobiales bacterium]
MTEDEIKARLLHRDGMLLVLDKPSGIAVHRGPKGGVNLADSFDFLRFGLPRAPALAHRLDRETSGCLVLGRHRKALERLGHLFKTGRVAKTYWAIVEGGPAENAGLIDKPLGRRDPTQGWWMKIDDAGLPAQTRWTVLGRGRDKHGRPITWIAMEPLTGRTHQLRVHAASMGWPIIGDQIYGLAERSPNANLQLHAREIVVPMSKKADPVRVVAPAPDRMLKNLRRCGWTEEMEPARPFRGETEQAGQPTPPAAQEEPGRSAAAE